VFVLFNGRVPPSYLVSRSGRKSRWIIIFARASDENDDRDSVQLMKEDEGKTMKRGAEWVR
jgi:hypothetical protein